MVLLSHLNSRPFKFQLLLIQKVLALQQIASLLLSEIWEGTWRAKTLVVLDLRAIIQAACGVYFTFFITTTGIMSKRYLCAEDTEEENMQFGKMSSIAGQIMFLNFISAFLGCGNPKTISFHDYNDDGVQEYLNSEAVPLLVEKQTTKAKSTNRSSGKDRIKALIADEMSKRSQLLRTRSIHYLESRDWPNQIIILRNPEAYSKQNLLSSRHAFSSQKSDKLTSTTSNQNLSVVDKHLTREFSCPPFKEYADVLEIFKVNKKSFLEIAQNPDVEALQDIHHTLNAKGRLRKSGSFPAADFSHLRYLRPSTLEHKKNEIWSSPKGGNLQMGVPSPKFDASNSLEDSHEMSLVSINADTTRSTQASSPSLASSHRLVKHGWNLSFMHHFKDIKKKIRHALKESKKESRRSHKLVNGHVQKVPFGGQFSVDANKMSEKIEETKVHQDGAESHLTNDSSNDLGESRLSSMRRASSVKDSVDRYTQLLEQSFEREAKWHQYQSRSLKLSNEDRSSSSGYSLKSFKRRLSLPELESFFPLPSEVVPDDDLLSSKIKSRTVMECDTLAENDMESTSIPPVKKRSEPLDVIEETELQEKEIESVRRSESCECSGDLIGSISEGIAKPGEPNENKIESEIQEVRAHSGQEIGSTICDHGENEEQSPVSVLKTPFQHDTTNPIDQFPAVEGSVLDSRQKHIREPDSSTIAEESSTQDSLSGLVPTAKPESSIEIIEKIIVDNHLLHSEAKGQQDDPDFYYVRDVLETSGFMDKGHAGTWYSLDQPLSPTLFKELEAYLHHHQQEPSSKEPCDHHHLLFDLINEELLNIYKSSLAYFPKHFSFTQPVRPLPKGSHVLEEVWERIKWYKNSKSLDQSLDDIVGRDLAKADGWLNLHLDVEDVALDLEDWIFDELLEDAVGF
ncbi:hypothetical protein Tsubulata_026310 [Turnera subulata]|uniref:DUF4378 domain-containing protein n=1 Tax=Turnera subulata TaxID=218843 RepID=A0A9Q0JKY1_9ROSI|nr:hypothetical protein Tsubulata_026310 [Turnera subulata]